jgi:hypothetical protein
MLHIFYSSYTCFFSGVSDVCYKCFSYFRHMLQVFHLYVAKVDLMLLMMQWDPPTVVHAHGKRRDGMWHGGERGKQKGMAAGALVAPAYACSRERAWAVPSVTGGTR